MRLPPGRMLSSHKSDNAIYRDPWNPRSQNRDLGHPVFADGTRSRTEGQAYSGGLTGDGERLRFFTGGAEFGGRCLLLPFFLAPGDSITLRIQ